MKADLKKRYERIMTEVRQLGIRPKMEIQATNGKLQGTFDLRSLNKEIIEKCR